MPDPDLALVELGPEKAGGWLKPGDVVELEIERLGVLRTPIAARPESARQPDERKKGGRAQSGAIL